MFCNSLLDSSDRQMAMVPLKHLSTTRVKRRITKTLSNFWGAHPLFVAAALADLLHSNDSGKFYTIFNIVLSLNKQVLPNIL